MEEILFELTDGIHVLANRIVYVEELVDCKVVKVFDLFTLNEERYIV